MASPAFVQTENIPFIRNRFTWLAYLMLGFYAYTQSTLGPLMPFLGDEMDLNYTLRGLHLSAFATGIIISSLLTNRLMQAFGRHRLFWGGGAGMALGSVLLTLMHVPLLTLLSAFILGFMGSFLLVAQQAGLADLHGERRAIAFTESNVIAAICASLGPLLVSQMEGLGFGWRFALITGALAWVLAAVIFNRTTIPGQDRSTTPGAADQGTDRLSRAFWLYWWVAILVISIEWCMVFWGADFLANVAGMSNVDAAGTMTLYFIAIVIGRVVSSRLARSVPVGLLLCVALIIVIIGFPVFWLAQVTPLNVVGLCLVGLGTASLFPLTLAAANGAAVGQSNKAAARISLAAGIAILAAPQLLGSAADQVGIFYAVSLTGILAVAALGLTIRANRANAAEAASQPAPKPAPQPEM